MIQLRGLTKRYGDTVAVDDLTLEVAPGRVTGFLGPNGAGKSTTMRMVLGLDHPTAGEALVARPAPPRQHDAAARRRGAAGGRRAPSRPQRPRPPAGRGPQQRHPAVAGRRGPRPGRPDRRRGAAGEGLLPGHAPAARHRRGTARRPRRAAVRRAGQRPGPRRGPVGPRPGPVAGRGGPHGAGLEPPHERDAADRRPPRRDRSRSADRGCPDRAGAGRQRRSRRARADPGADPLAEALSSLGAVDRVDDRELVVTGVAADRVGELAHSLGVPLHELTELRGSLEQAYMELTAASVEYAASPTTHPTTDGATR